MLPLILVAVGAYLIGDSVLGDKKYAHGGKTQGYDDKEDERLAMERGKMSKKDLDSTHARRDDAQFEERGKMEDGGMMAEGGEVSTKLKMLKEKSNGYFPNIEPTKERSYYLWETPKSAKSSFIIESRSVYSDVGSSFYIYDKDYKFLGSANQLNGFNDVKPLRITKSDVKFEDGGMMADGSMMADGGMMDEVNTEVIAVKGNIMGTTTLDLKIKGMRKPQDFIVYPISTEQAGKPITIQSDTRFGYLDLSSGRGLMSQSHANGAYSYHFSSDKKVPFKISETDVKKIKEHLSSKASSKAGNNVIFSDNSGAGMMAKGGKLVGKQKNLDVNKNGKLDAEDFKMLRKGK